MKNKPENIIIEAVVGSTAYGLATKDSDIDILGVFVAPTDSFLGMRPPTDKDSTLVNVNPDYQYHEVGKFFRLASACNPTIVELLFMPRYLSLSTAGRVIISNRDAFLSNHARKTYAEYATSQVQRLLERGGTFNSDLENRREKHARHCFRLFDQCEQLLTTGKIDVVVKDPGLLFQIGRLPDNELYDLFLKRKKELDEIDSVLPDQPDLNRLEDLLVGIRRLYDS